MIKRNKNWLAIICGETGSGKSYSGLSMVDEISPRGCDARRCVVFDPVQFLNKVTHTKDLRKGDIIIFDEAGVGMSSREWYSVQNKLLGSVLQTFRNLNVGVIFTTPNLSFVDVQARKLFHNYFETAYVDYKTQLAYMKAYDIQHNSRYDKTYYKHPRIKDGDGRVVSVGYLAIPKPRKELVADYEQMKQEYTETLNSKALDTLTTPKEKKSNKLDYKSLAADIKGRHKEFINKRGGIDTDLIAADLGIGRNTAITIKKIVDKDLGL
jgi:hypothetical protein